MFIIHYKAELTNETENDYVAVPGDDVVDAVRALLDNFSDNGDCIWEMNIKRMNYDDGAKCVYLPSDHEFLEAFKEANDY